MSWIEQLHRAQAELTKRDADPLREKVEGVVRGMEAVSTVALLDLLGLSKTTGNGRRLRRQCARLGFVPINRAGSCRAATVTPSPAVGRARFGRSDTEQGVKGRKVPLNVSVHVATVQRKECTS